jgi:predicted nuclease of predicted toxin-antitoxin system
MRTLLLDENLPLRLAAELTARGHPAVALRRDARRAVLDAEVLAATGERVLVTAQEDLPREQAATLRRTGATVAVVHADGETAKRETVHRWAHVMAAQPRGTVRRYAPHRGGRA